MKKILNLNIILSMLFISLLSIVSYEYKYDSYITRDYEGVRVAKSKSMTDEQLKEVIINNKFTDDILIKQRTIRKNKNIYDIYTNSKQIKINNFGIFSKITLNHLKDANSSSINNNQVYIKKNNTNEYIKYLEDNEIEVEDLGASINKSYFTKDTLIILIILLIITLFSIYFYISSRFKCYSLMKLEGLTDYNILKEEVFNIFKRILLIFFILSTGILLLQLVLIKSLNLSMLMSIILQLVLYALFILVSIITIYYKGFSKNFISYLKNGTTYSYTSLVILKTGLLVIVIFTSSSLLEEYKHISNSISEIEKYSKYNNYVVSKTYAPILAPIVNDAVGMEEALYKYYSNTKDKFNGIIYHVNDHIKEIQVNDTALDLMNIKTKSGKKVNSTDYSKEVVTHFKVNKEAEDEDFKEYENIEYIEDNYKFLNYDLVGLDFNIQEGGWDIYYYPDNLKDPLDREDLTSPITQGGYFLDVDSKDNYETLKPYIYEAGAENFVISAPNITEGRQELLGIQIENITYDIIKLISLASVTIFLIFILVKTYMMINIKKIVVSELEGRKDFFKRMTLHSFVMYIFLIIINIIFSLNLLILILMFLILEEFIIYAISKKYLKENRIKALKGDM